ncbi:MAG: hypothetical protein AABX11_02315 [Nanoarchaeota archaeon]
MTSELTTLGWMKELRDKAPMNYYGISGALELYLNAQDMIELSKTGKVRPRTEAKKKLINLTNTIGLGVPISAMIGIATIGGAVAFGFYNGITGQPALGNGNGLNARDIVELCGIAGASGALATGAIIERENLGETVKNVAGSLTFFPAGVAMYHGIGFGIGCLAREMI